MTVSFYLTRPEAKTDTSIFARISYEGFKIKYYTPEKINPKYWSKETKLARQTDKFKEYPEFNQRLKDWKTGIANIYRKWINDNGGMMPKPQTLKTLLDKELKGMEPEKEAKKTLFFFFEDLIAQTKTGTRLQPNSGRPYTPATIQVYANTLRRLKEYVALYRRKIDFETINLDFLATLQVTSPNA